MVANKDVRLLVRCAKLYHEEDMKQEDIGAKLGISKATVSRLLNQAKELGIIKVVVHNPDPNDFIELEKSLEERFGLKEVVIADISSDDEGEVKREIAREAARYLQRVLKQDTFIGVASGTTLAAIPKYVHNNRANNFTFVPMVGGSGQSRAEIHSNNIAQNFAKAFKAQYRILHAPAMVEKIESKTAFTEDPGIKTVLSLTEKLDVALIGIGASTSNSTVTMIAEFITAEELIRMENDGAVADICNFFIDEKGNGDRFETNQRVIGIDLMDLRKTPLTIAIAGHCEKINAISSVIQTDLVDVLITDINTAQNMLKEV